MPSALLSEMIKQCRAQDRVEQRQYPVVSLGAQTPRPGQHIDAERLQDILGVCAVLHAPHQIAQKRLTVSSQRCYDHGIVQIQHIR